MCDARESQSSDLTFDVFLRVRVYKVTHFMCIVRRYGFLVQSYFLLLLRHIYVYQITSTNIEMSNLISKNWALHRNEKFVRRELTRVYVSLPLFIYIIKIICFQQKNNLHVTLILTCISIII